MSNFQAGRLPHSLSSHGGEKDPFINSYAAGKSGAPHNGAAPRAFAKVSLDGSAQPANKPALQQTAYAPQPTLPMKTAEKMTMARPPAPFQQVGFQQSAEDIPELKDPFAKQGDEPPEPGNAFRAGAVQNAHFETSEEVPPEIDQTNHLLHETTTPTNPFAATEMSPETSQPATTTAQNPFAKFAERTPIAAPKTETVILHKEESAVQPATDQWRSSNATQPEKSITPVEKGFVLPSAFEEK